jgi:hypothetical protein
MMHGSYSSMQLCRSNRGHRSSHGTEEASRKWTFFVLFFRENAKASRLQVLIERKIHGTSLMLWSRPLACRVATDTRFSADRLQLLLHIRWSTVEDSSIVVVPKLPSNQFWMSVEVPSCMEPGTEAEHLHSAKCHPARGGAEMKALYWADMCWIVTSSVGRAKNGLSFLLLCTSTWARPGCWSWVRLWCSHSLRLHTPFFSHLHIN